METTSLFHTASKRGISSGINVCLLLEDAFSTSPKSKIHLLQQKVGIFYIAIYAQNNKLSDMILPYDEIMNKTKRLLLYTFPGPGDKELIPKKIAKSIIFSLVAVKKKGRGELKNLGGFISTLSDVKGLYVCLLWGHSSQKVFTII